MAVVAAHRIHQIASQSDRRVITVQRDFLLRRNIKPNLHSPIITRLGIVCGINAASDLTYPLISNDLEKSAERPAF
jgi:hypothetical protein